MRRRAGRREGEVQGHWRRPRHRLRGAYPQGINILKTIGYIGVLSGYELSSIWLGSLQHHKEACSTARDSHLYNNLLLYILYS